jgi:four helix bundle protein
MNFIFENLEVYQKSVDFAEKISNLTDAFPRGNYYLVDQINRASLSVSANIAEGNGRFHSRDKKNFLYISRGSLHECIPLMEICRRKGLINSKKADELKNEAVVIGKMLSGLISGLK